MSNTPRIPPVEPPYAPDVDEHLRKLMPPGVPPLVLFRTVAHNPRVLGRLRRGGLLDPGSITLRERELVILRTTARCGAEYEWGVHAAFFGGAAGFGASHLYAVVHGPADAPIWSPREQVLLALCDALHASSTVDDALWARARAELEPAQLVEVLVLAGLYHMVSFVVNATALPLEAAAPRFPTPPPPDAR
jgi:alkylhydroperoxidase family enzyme